MGFQQTSKRQHHHSNYPSTSAYEAQVPIEFSVEADLNHRYRDDQNEILSYPNQSYWLDEKEDDFHLRTLRWVFETIPALD